MFRVGLYNRRGLGKMLSLFPYFRNKNPEIMYENRKKRFAMKNSRRTLSGEGQNFLPLPDWISEKVRLHNTENNLELGGQHTRPLGNQDLRDLEIGYENRKKRFAMKDSHRTLSGEGRRFSSIFLRTSYHQSNAVANP